MRLNGLELMRLVEQAQRLEDFEEAIAGIARDLPPAHGVDAVLEFLEVPAGDAFDVKPQQAIDYFKAKGLKPTFSYAEMMGAEHDKAFTVAKMMNVDMLAQVRNSLDVAMANGTPFKEWADGLIPILQSGGWWGRQEVVDPVSKQVVVAQLGSPWRLETIFRTNMQTAYAAGAWQEIIAQKDVAPFLMYDAVDDDRTRPLHASWDRRVMRVDAAWWGTHFPPNGYNCRCGVIQLSQSEVDALGLHVSVDAPKDGTFTWKNPRTGEEYSIPNGLDPGFVNNAGQNYAFDLKMLAKEKAAALAADMQAAAAKAEAAAAEQAKKAVEAASASAVQAQKDAAAAAGKAALERAKAKAAEASKQWAAQQQLDLILAGKTADPGNFFANALKKLKAAPEWLHGAPAQKMDALTALASELKAKHALQTKLSQFKKAILEGKNPSPAVAQAFKSLPQDEAIAFMAKVDAEKKALEKAAAEAAAKAAAKAAEEAAAAAAKAAEEAAAAAAKEAEEAAAKAAAEAAAKAAQEAEAQAAAQATAKAAFHAMPVPQKPKYLIGKFGGMPAADVADAIRHAMLKGDVAKIDELYSIISKAPPSGTKVKLKTFAAECKAWAKAKADVYAPPKPAAPAAPAPAPQPAPAPVPQPEAPSKAATFVDTTPPDPATMVMIGAKSKGGTPGALYQDTATGQKWLIKFNGSADAVQNEVLSAKLYTLAGVEAPELHAITIEGKPALASRIIDGIKEVPAKTLASTPSVTDGFAVDAWLANWDVAGLNFDNVVLVNGRAVRIDVGGSLRYRAVGGLKGSAFGDSVGEIESMRDGTNAQARAVFGAMSPQDVERSVERVLSISDADIRAIVLRYGPPDEAERRALAERMVARKADLARRYPAAAERVKQRAGAAQEPQKATDRVTVSEQEAVEASRVNGYGFATDSDQIEDNMVVVHAFKKADGSDATRGYFKLLPGASKELQASIAQFAGGSPTVPLSQVRDSILAAVKSINFRADKGQLLDVTVAEKVKLALQHANAAELALRKAAEGAKNAAELHAKAEAIAEWRSILSTYGADAQAKKPAVKIGKMFDAKAFPDELGYEKAAKDAGALAGPKWRRVDGQFAFETASFERSFARENGGKASVSGVGVRYETMLDDGTRVTYFPHDSKVAFAMQGVVKIDVPGRGVDSTTRVFSTISDIGLKSTRAVELDRQHLYLNAFARIALLRGQGAKFKAEFAAITDKSAEGVRAKLALLKRATGVDIEGSEGWRQIDGVRQAFGHGRAYQMRPDLSPAQMGELDRTHVLFHNPQGLGTSAGSGVFERLKVVIEGGGAFASLTDRVRRGVPLSGSSVASDLSTGGGDYHFTRIRTRSAQAGNTGVYWKVHALRRMDAITYSSDMFGQTSGTSIDDNRLGQDIASFKTVAGRSSNETIFKGGMSIFDDLDRIVLSSQSEVDAAIKWLQSKGYRTWPDGRDLADVIINSAKHRAKP